ncbi:NAD(P)-binding protein [Ustulina deusta]|nr:NAD(P)-binding protein [Ustulina deusta]KAI3329792.1 NAD(P)-binding protein [Ustulina deusta]
MPKVLILGGAGYLGLAVGQALLRSGNHSVFATTRDGDKVKTLTANEITPIKGDATDSKFLVDTIAAYHIDVVIDTTQAYGGAGNILGSVVQAARNRAGTLAKDKAIGPKLGFVYTSGSWVHGSPDRRISDLTVPGTSLAGDKPATAVGWRPAHEQAILAARDVLDVAILRPGSIYGRASSVFGVWWGPLLAASKSGSQDPVGVPVDAKTRTGVVHVDDLGAAYLAAVDKIGNGLGSWPVFDLTTETVAIDTLLTAVASLLGVKGPIQYQGTHGDAFLEAVALVVSIDASRARSVLGWEPKRRDFLQNLDIIVPAWQSHQK